MNRNVTRNNNETVTNEDTRRKMADDTEFGPRKTIVVLAIVAGCFAILWPKIFYPMISSPVNTIHTPGDGPGCCDLIFESDVNAVDIMQEMCKNILRHHQVDPRIRDALKSSKLTPQSASFCREEVLARCGIDLSSFLTEKERLGKTYKQVLEEIRSFNSSLCLKRQFGVPLSQLGTPHLIRYHILMPHSPMRQERRVPLHAGGLHPALQQRGRAIPSSHIVPKVDGRPDHVVIEKMRPPMGAAGRVVPAPSGNSSMGIIMPLYTLGIFLFFLYTIAKVMRKNSDNEIYAEYQNPAAEREFRNKVFNPEVLTSAMTGAPCYRKERPPSPLRPVPTIEELKEQAAGDIEIDQLRQRLADTEAAMERIVVQMGSLSRTVVHSESPHQDTQLQDECALRSCCSNQNGVEEPDESSATVKVMGMEMTACCEGGQKISRPTTPVITYTHTEREITPPKPIYLEGALPPQCELLVTDSETQAENSEDDTEAPVVLSGKMTLSLISHDQNQAEAEDKSLEMEEHRKNLEHKSGSTESIGNSDTQTESEECDEISRTENDTEEEEESEAQDEDDDQYEDENYEDDDDDDEEEDEDEEDDEEVPSDEVMPEEEDIENDDEAGVVYEEDDEESASDEIMPEEDEIENEDEASITYGEDDEEVLGVEVMPEKNEIEDDDETSDVCDIAEQEICDDFEDLYSPQNHGSTLNND